MLFTVPLMGLFSIFMWKYGIVYCLFGGNQEAALLLDLFTILFRIKDEIWDRKQIHIFFRAIYATRQENKMKEG